MQYEAQEIDEARIQEGEEEELIASVRLAQSAIHIQEACLAAYGALRGEGDYGEGGVDALNRALSELQDIEGLDEVEALADSFIAGGCRRDCGGRGLGD